MRADRRKTDVLKGIVAIKIKKSIEAICTASPNVFVLLFVAPSRIQRTDKHECTICTTTINELCQIIYMYMEPEIDRSRSKYFHRTRMSVMEGFYLVLLK